MSYNEHAWNTKENICSPSSEWYAFSQGLKLWIFFLLLFHNISSPLKEISVLIISLKRRQIIEQATEFGSQFKVVVFFVLRILL